MGRCQSAGGLWIGQPRFQEPGHEAAHGWRRHHPFGNHADPPAVWLVLRRAYGFSHRLAHELAERAVDQRYHGEPRRAFDTVNAKVGEIAVQVGTTPAAWNAGVFSLIRQLSETVILPIAGLVLTFVATYELIQMLLEKNNMHEFDVANIYKWVFKTACAILILSNTFDIVMAVFDVSQSVIADAAGLIQGSTDITPDMLAELETTLEGMELGPLLGLWLQSSVIGLTMQIMGIIIFVLVYGRMIEIYLMTSLAPLPVATLSNRELGGTGQNYLKSLFAVGFQGMLILVCVAIYAVLVQGIATGGDPIGAIWGTVGYTVLLCFMLFKTGGIAQRIFGAH